MNSTNYKFSIMLTLLLAFSMKGFAQFSGGAGTEGDPYLISTAADLSQLATYVNENNASYNNKHYKLANDIDISTYENWSLIGTDGYKAFLGVFDGNNKKITGLTINAPLQYAGLFGYTAGATIKNLGVTEINMITTCGNDYAFAGGIIGCAWARTDISNCYTSGSINSSADTHFSLNTGGVVGRNYEGAVSNCYSSAIITTSSTNTTTVGGIVGHNMYTFNFCLVKDCYFTGTINAFGEGNVEAGGIVGSSGSKDSVLNCYATGSINASQTSSSISSVCAGGVVGSNGGTVSKCWASGSVKASSDRTAGGAMVRAGGVVGANGSNTLSNCYATASVTAFANSPATPEAVAGGVAGSTGNTSKISYCYATGAVSATATTTANVAYANAGGIVGSKLDANLTHCAALNPSIVCVGKNLEFGRVTGSREQNLSDNIGFASMINPDGVILWNNIGHDKLDGASITIPEILADGTLGGLFTAPVWTTKNGKLPGLSGETVNLPQHLGGVGVDELDPVSGSGTNYELRVYPNPTTGVLNLIQERITNYELGYPLNSEMNIKVFDVMGRVVTIPNPSFGGAGVVDISNLPAGVYFIRLQTENGTVTKKVVKQ